MIRKHFRDGRFRPPDSLDGKGQDAAVFHHLHGELITTGEMWLNGQK